MKIVTFMRKLLSKLINVRHTMDEGKNERKNVSCECVGFYWWRRKLDKHPKIVSRINENICIKRANNFSIRHDNATFLIESNTREY